jgi:hypothetical protein
MRPAVVLMAILHLGIISGLAASASPSDQGASGQAMLGTAAGTVWEKQLRNPDDPHAHIDTPATIRRLRALHANTYQFLVQYPTDWQDLSAEFMPAAQRAGITVIAYLVPPSECSSSASAPQSCDQYAPFRADYVAWGVAIAQLSVQYPALRGWTVDDMDTNLGLFTPAYVGAMNAAASAIQPELDLYLQLYWPSLSKSFFDRYTNTFDGVIMPYRDGEISDTAMTDTLQQEIDGVSQMLSGTGAKLIVMLYGNTLSRTQVSPDVDYVSRLVDAAMANIRTGKIDGVIVWNLELAPTAKPADSSRNLARTGVGALSLSLAADTATVPGQYAEASSTIRLNSGSSSCGLRFWTRDVDAPGVPGYHDIQLFVGTDLVWEQDAASNSTSWTVSPPLSVTAGLVNGTAPLRVRLTELKAASDFETNVVFDDFSSTGCSVWNPRLETDNGWTLTRSDGSLVPAIYQYSPSFTTDVFTAVANRYRWGP